MNRAELIKKFAAGPNHLRSALDSIPVEAYDFRPDPSAWTIREIIIHMPDSETSGYVRVRKIIAESGAEVDVYDQVAWAGKLKYGDSDIQLAIDLFDLMRQFTVSMLSRVDENTWSENYITHPEDGKLTLATWLEVYARHAEKHAAQIRRNFEAWEQAGRP